MSELNSDLLELLSPEFRSLFLSLPVSNQSNRKLRKVVPAKTLSISTSGTFCEQNCLHCQSHYLKGMQTLDKISLLDTDKYNSALISGGSNTAGAVFLQDYAEAIKKIPSHLALNIHPGFQSPENLNFLSDRNITVSFDLPASNNIINNIFRLPYSVKDYQELYLEYSRSFKTVPHITLGLDSPECDIEEICIDFLEQQQPEAVVFIVFRPTPQTALARQNMPEIKSIIELFCKARQKLSSRLLLGCMRPSGLYRQNLDILAWQSGITEIVQPDKKFLNALTRHGVEITETKECCAL